MGRRIDVGLIGAGIGASKSPMLHMTEGAAQGIDLHYHLIDLTARDIGDPVTALPILLAEAEAAGFAGVNVTHPCKQLVIGHLDSLSADAALLGAVNTVIFDRDSAGGPRRIGHNTDWWGFMEGFRAQAPDADLSHVVQIGAGGAGVAVAHALWRMGVTQLAIYDVDPQRADNVVASLNMRAGVDFAYRTPDYAHALATASGLVHCTPIGMADHPGMAIDPALIAPDQFVADIVYFPLDTALLQAARARGCQIIDGGGMAVFQAVEAFRLFTGQHADAGRMMARFRASLQ